MFHKIAYRYFIIVNMPPISNSCKTCVKVTFLKWLTTWCVQSKARNNKKAHNALPVNLTGQILKSDEIIENNMSIIAGLI